MELQTFQKQGLAYWIFPLYRHFSNYFIKKIVVKL